MYNWPMDKRSKFSEEKYAVKNPSRAKVIKKAVKRATIEYAETFKRLAAA